MTTHNTILARMAIATSAVVVLAGLSSPALARDNETSNGKSDEAHESHGNAYGLEKQSETGEGSDSDHDGDAGNDSTPYTEDNDTIDNDGADVDNNIVDEGDNAHPSGKDRSVEHGESGNQGNSESAPDEDGHGPERDWEGTDKPNGSGGVDKDDQDGNNGCGNDDDFEDDNNGNCGPKEKPAKNPATYAG